MSETWTPRRCLLGAVTAMIGGETLCIFGPLQYPRLIHRVCHAIFYAGVALCAWGAVMYARSRVGKRPSQDSIRTPQTQCTLCCQDHLGGDTEIVRGGIKLRRNFP